MAQVIICGGISLVPYVRPVGIYQLANVLRSNGYTVQVIDSFPYIAHLGIDTVKKVISKFVGPETLWIGFGSTWFMRIDEIQKRTTTDITAGKTNKPVSKVNSLEQLRANTLLFTDEEIHDFKKEIHSINPNVKFVMGGARAFIGRGALGAPLHDYYIEGYADNTVLELTDFLQGKTDSINAIDSRGDYGSKCLIHDHKATEFDYNNFKFTWDESDLIWDNEMLPIEIARGCIFNCAFCAYPLNGRAKMDYLKDPKILREQFIENYDRFGTTKYFFLDDTFNDSPEKLRILYNEVTSKLPFDIEFQAYLRLDLINAHPDTMYILRDMGIRGASFGVESLNYEANKTVGKGIKLDKIINISEQLQKEWKDVYIESQYILGLPNDGEEEIREWLDILLSDGFPMPPTQVLPLHLDKLQYRKNIWTSKFEKDPDSYGYTFPDENNSMVWKNNKGLTLHDATRIRDEYEFRWKESARPSWMMQEGRKLIGVEPILKGSSLSSVQMMAGDGHIDKRIEWVKQYIQRLLSL